jgi:hypothetical protein
VAPNVEVTAKGTTVECPVSVDGYEPIFEMSSILQDSSRELQLALMISKNENNMLPLLGSSAFGFITSSEPGQAGCFTFCHEYLASRLKGNVRHVQTSSQRNFILNLEKCYNSVAVP